ncbi:MAG: pyridoxamine 5'-phosphate oxidase [Thermoanaerobaculia bacterium]|nr:pyridoxamine 5'-phosphate oxidase [Thermoanaerobaculia bacterium]
MDIKEPLSEEPRATSHEDPFRAFAEVFDEAKASGIRDPNAMVLSTVGPDGQPSSRVVLLKAFDERGFVFYTNLESRKGRELAGNPKVSLSFFWRDLDRQVVILGTAQPVSDAEADAYFASRARVSQLGAWASKQSRELASRAALLREVAKVEARYLVGSVPRPSHWSGFRVAPHWIEFWAAGKFRLHDRKVFTRSEDGDWSVQRLNP